MPDPPRSSRLAEHLIDSETVVVAFSGLGTLEGGRHAFNFLSFSADATFSSILVRDPEDCWYHGSVPGIGRGCRALASHLAERTSGYRRVVCIGASMGGYAALLFGHLLGADRVLAFGPQVLLDPAVLRSFGDLRWIERIDRIQDLGVEPAFLDLSRLLVAAPASKTMFDVYVSADNHLDMRHAAPLLANPAVTVTPVRATRHNLVGPIRRFGILRRLLGRVVAGHPPLDVGVELATERERRRHDLALAGSVDVDPEARSLRLVTRVINTSPEVWDAATGFLAALSVECQVVESGTGRIVHRVGAGLPSSPMEPGDAGVRSFDLSYVGLPAGLYEAQVILCESGMRYEAIGCEPLTVGFELGPDVTPLWVRTPMGRTGRFGPADPDRPGTRAWAAHLDEPGTWWFEARQPVLQTRTGLKRRDRFRLDAAPAGFALFGPYLSLPAGSYEAEILFDPDEPVRGAAVADVARDAGSVVVQDRVTFDGETGVVIRLAWMLAEPAAQVEVRLRNEAGFTGSIVGLRVVHCARDVAGALSGPGHPPPRSATDRGPGALGR